MCDAAGGKPDGENEAANGAWQKSQRAARHDEPCVLLRHVAPTLASTSVLVAVK